MTICIAAIADGNKIIAITDKMVTVGAPVATRYEISESNKAVCLSDHIVGLFAGDVVAANEILTLAKNEIKSEHKSVLEVAEIVQKAYQNYLQDQLQQQLFNRFGIDRNVFMSNQRNLDQALVQRINGIMIEANLNVEITVAGIDSDTAKPHIYSVRNPGVLNNMDVLAYSCIGSGSQHASFSLIEAEYNSGFSKERSLFALVEAKKRAEYDPGVGQLSDIVIIDGKFKKLSSEQVNKIDSEYRAAKKELEKVKKAHSLALFSVV